MSPAPAPANLRRKRPRVVVLLTTALSCLPSVAGFGLSGVGALSPARRTAVADAAIVRSAWGGRTAEWRRRRAHEITCRVPSPKRYGSADWFSNIQNLPKSRLLYNIKGHLFYNTMFAFAVSMVHLLTPQHIIDDLHVSAIPHSIMSGALGLLLVFRTNAAYNRFWEARKIWGGLINTCRNIARLGAVALGPDSVEWQEMKEYVRMFPFLLKQHLQDTREDSELDWASLPKEDILRLQGDPNPPMFACQKMTEILAGAFADGGGGQSKGGRVPDFTSVTYRMEIERNLSSLMDALGMCERILTTPVPRGYSRHTSRFLTVYGFTLPIVLVPHTELFTAPVVAAVCWGLFSIEEIAYFIEQPFDPEYRQLDLIGFSEKVARDVERITVSSSLGRQGPLASPQLPGATTGVNGGLLAYQLAEGGNNGHSGVDGHHAFEGRWGGGLAGKTGRDGGGGGGGEVNGSRSGGDGGVGKDGSPVAVKPTGADGLSKSWSGAPDDDIIGD